MTFPRQHAETGWAYRGSQRHIQAYVNDCDLRCRLEAEVRAAFPPLTDVSFEWKCPLQKARYAELGDDTLLPAIGCAHLTDQITGFWPRGGPSWDAVALAKAAGQSAVVLVEAKANLAEFDRGHRRATRPESVELIDTSLVWARERLGATGSSEAWSGPAYQLANRLAWAVWLREAGVDTFLVHLLFENDASYRPTSGEELKARTAQGHEALGVPAAAVHEWAASIVLPAIP